jgi:hypothetical protein
MRRIRKRTMRNPPCPSIIHRIKALDEQGLIRSLRILKVPLMFWIRLDGECLPLTVWIDQRGGNEITFWHGMGVGEGEGVAEDGFDGTPDLSGEGEQVMAEIM